MLILKIILAAPSCKLAGCQELWGGLRWWRACKDVCALTRVCVLPPLLLSVLIPLAHMLPSLPPPLLIRRIDLTSHFCFFFLSAFHVPLSPVEGKSPFLLFAIHLTCSVLVCPPSTAAPGTGWAVGREEGCPMGTLDVPGEAPVVALVTSHGEGSNATIFLLLPALTWICPFSLP